QHGRSNDQRHERQAPQPRSYRALPRFLVTNPLAAHLSPPFHFPNSKADTELACCPHTQRTGGHFDRITEYSSRFMLRMIETVIELLRTGTGVGVALGSCRERSLSVTRWTGTELLSPAWRRINESFPTLVARITFCA